MTSASSHPTAHQINLRRLCNPLMGFITFFISVHNFEELLHHLTIPLCNHYQHEGLKPLQKPQVSRKPHIMYTNINIPLTNEIPYVYSSSSSSTPEFLGHFSTATLPAPLAIPVNEYDSLCALKSEFGYNSGCSSYTSPASLTSYATTNNNSSNCDGSPNSLTSYEAKYSPNLMQGSISSNSMLHRKNVEGFSALILSPTGYHDSETSPVGEVFSTGDLEGLTSKQHSHRLDSSLANEYRIIESMSKACRYSPEEKKERIERYRSKRNLRNFNKKIKYECRKTLADGRPRIRGRFARNDEIEKTSQNQWDHADIGEEEEDNDSWINILDKLSASLIP